MRPSPVLITTAFLTLIAPAAASAGYFQSQPIDATPGIQRVNDIDIAHDGSGAVAYIRSDGGVDHVFVSRLVNGVFQSPERVDGPLAGAGSAPAVAASDGGRVSVVFVNGGAVYATTRQAGGTAFTQPQMLASSGSDPSVDMSINGVGYASFSSGGDVRAATVKRGQTQFTTLPTPLDSNPSNDAGTGLGRSHVAASADGSGVVVWGENGRIFARRVYSDHAAASPIDMTADSLDGHAGGAADSPWVDIEDDSSFAWVIFREKFDDGRMHNVARRLVGSAPDPPAEVDGLGYNGDNAATGRVEINGRGEGVLSSGSGAFASFVSLIHDDKVFPAAAISGVNTVNPQPVGGEAENNDVFVAWMQGTPLAATVHVVSYDVNLADRGVPGPSGDTQLSADALGRVDPNGGFDLAMDRVGDMATVFIQDDGTTRRLVAAGSDRVPGPFNAHSATPWRKATRPSLSWQTSFDLWGVTYDVQVDGVSLAKTTATSIKLPVRVPDGVHQWQVIATDSHGQTVSAPVRTLRVDSTPPAIAFTVKGTRKVGKKVKVAADVADGSLESPVGSGVAKVTIAWGDGSTSTGRSASHVYRHRGAHTIKVTATDRAGNQGVLTRRVRIRK